MSQLNLLPGGPAYYKKVLGIQPSNLIGYWPMWEKTGAIAFDLSPQKNNGAYTAVALGQAGIGDGNTSASFDGDSASSFNNVYSAALNADFDGAEGTLMAWGKVANTGVWTDSTARNLGTFRADNNNRLWIDKDGGANRIRFFYEAGNVVKNALDTSITDALFHLWAMTWSDDTNADELKGYVDGLQIGSTITGLGTWANNLTSTTTVVGSANITPQAVWDGYLAHVAIWNIVLTATQIAELAVV